MKWHTRLSLLRDLAAVRYFRKSSSEKSGTLIVRLDRIGDFALYAPFAHSGMYPGEKTYFLVNSLWAELCTALFPECEVIPLDPRTFLQSGSYRAKMLKQIAALKVKRVLQPRFYRELLLEGMITAAATPDECFQFAATPLHLQYPLLKYLASSGAMELEYLPGEHELQRNLRFAQKCVSSFELKNPWLNHPFEVPEKFKTEEYLCVFPGSGKGSYCCWPLERWSALLNSVKIPRILICGTAAEKEFMESIAANVSGKNCSVVHNVSLLEFAGIVSRARCTIGNDTGGIHLSAMSGVPSLAISGRGQPGWFLPYPEISLPPGCVSPLVVTTPCSCENCFWRCTHLHNGICRCIDDISVAQVLETMEENNFSALR